MQFCASVVVVLCCLCQYGAPYNILGIFPHPGKSHFDVFEPLLERLAETGHNMTVITHYPHEKPLPRYREISLEGTAMNMLNFIDLEMLKQYARTVRHLAVLPLSNFAENTCATLQTDIMQNFIKNEPKDQYDLILIEMFNSDCYHGLIPLFKAPFIGLSSCMIMPWTNDRFGNIDNPAYIPLMFLGFPHDMTFLERVENSVMYVVYKIMYHMYMELPGYEAARKGISQSVPPLWEIAQNASLLLVNSHFSLTRARPFVPSIIEIGGMHLKPHKPIPKHIEKWINESAHGVIYFSMGSMIKGHSFPPETRKAFLKAFSKLPQRVLWKWENESIPDQPSNVMIQKWMPQYDILCHPNVKAYISHGGLLGTTEAVWCGVPMVVMPQYGDQFANAAALQASGGGIILNFNEVTEETVTNTLRTILAPSFNKQAQKLSAAFKDRPMPPLETAIYWVEYVARHGGAHFMRTKAVGMPWYQYLLLDVIAFLLAVFLVIMAVLYYSLKMFFRLFATKGEKIKTN